MNREDILKRLLDGEDPNSIAEEMAKAFNEAQKEYDYIQEEEKRKAEEEELAKIKAEERAKEDAKLQEAIDKRTAMIQKMEEVMMDYIAEFHPEVFAKLQEEDRMSQDTLLDIASTIDTVCAIISMGLL